MSRGLSNADYLRLLRAIAKAAGLCVQCRCRPQLKTRTCCAVCDSKGKEAKSRLKREGRCKCGKRTRRGKGDCVACAQSNSARSIARRVAAKAIRQRSACFKRKAVTDRVACKSCLDRASATQKRRRVARAVSP